MSEIKFGPSGNSRGFYEAGYKSSVDAPRWLREIGLSAYEYSFGQGVRLNDATATAIGDAARTYGIEVSVHAPYFVSFASDEPQKAENSFGYVLNSLRKLDLMGGSRCVMHTASCGKLERAEAIARSRTALTELAVRVREAGLGHLRVCPETMGRYAQIGTAEEIVDFCTIDEIYVPCFDFGHINCYLQGRLDRDAYDRIFDYAFEKLPEEKARSPHVHFSKIQFGAKGEIRHLTLADEIYGPDFETFAEAILRYRLTPVVICESAEIMAEDALSMQDTYLSIASRS